MKVQQCLDSCTRQIFALYQLSLKLGSGILTFGRRLATPFLFLCVRSQQQLHCKPNMEISFAKNDWMVGGFSTWLKLLNKSQIIRLRHLFLHLLLLQCCQLWMFDCQNGSGQVSNVVQYFLFDIMVNVCKSQPKLRTLYLLFSNLRIFTKASHKSRFSKGLKKNVCVCLFFESSFSDNFHRHF